MKVLNGCIGQSEACTFGGGEVDLRRIADLRIWNGLCYPVRH